MLTEYEINGIVLRVLNEKQAPLVLNFYEKNLEEFSKYEPIPKKDVHLLNYQAKNLKLEYDAFSQGKLIRFYIFKKENPFRIIGTVSYRNIHYGYLRSCEIGYKMDRDFQHMGYMHEAIGFLDRRIFEMGVHRIEAYVLPDNEKSLNLLKGLGYNREGLLHDRAFLNGKFVDNVLLSHIEET